MKTPLVKLYKSGNSKLASNATNDVVQKMNTKTGGTKKNCATRCYCKYNCTTSTCISLHILVTLSVPSPGEAASALQSNQLIHRQSTSSNNQGSEIILHTFVAR